MKYSAPLLLFITLLLMLPESYSQNATEIVDKANRRVYGESSYSEMTMTIVRPDWSREVSMKAWSLDIDYYLILITAPARDKGQVFLKRDNEMWNWVPTIDRMVKIPPSMMMQSWMGSDFKNNDLLEQESLVDDYDHKITGSETIDSYDCYKIEMTPKPDAAVVWGKVIAWITKDHYNFVRFEYYDEDGMLENTRAGKDIKDMDGKVIPTVLEMVPEDEEGHKTIIRYDDLKFNISIQKSFFSKQNMKNIK